MPGVQSAPLGNILFEPSDEVGRSEAPEASPARALVEAAQTRLNDSLDPSELVRVRKDAALQQRVMGIIRQAIEELDRSRVVGGRQSWLTAEEPLEIWAERAFDLLYGLGPLEALLDDDSVEDVAVNGPGEVYVRTAVGWQYVPLDLAADPEELQWRVNQVIAFSGKQAGPLQPIVDVQLLSDHRLNVVTAPLTETWPVLVIRRHRPVTWSLDEFVRQPSEAPERRRPLALPDYAAMEAPNAFVSAEAAAYLHMAVQAGLNILVIGRTGVGKTSFLSALGQLIPHNRRVVVVEDTRELQLRPGGRPMNCVYFVTRRRLLEGGIDVDLRQLIVTALRQRPDHLVVGEARGAEIYDLLNAMQTGHGGNLTSIHANSLADLAQRVNAMLFQAGVEMDPDRSARLMGRSFHVGVSLFHDFDGRRYVGEIGEFTGEVSDGLPALHRLFGGGPEQGFGLERLADRSVHEDRLRRVGLSFDRVLRPQGEAPQP